MNIGIIDADLIGRKQHNFPNLAAMKLSGYNLKQGNKTELIHFEDINPNSLFVRHFDKVYISKVFTDTQVPENILKLPFVEYGGTGFFYDKAPNLPDEIEHSFPDYNLYDSWIKEKIRNGKKPSYFKYYTEFSIGFTTRGCFRQCEFCVNRNEKRVYPHSPLNEFVDEKRKKICLLDDNVLGCGQHWERIIKELQATKKPFQFKQGMDIRILTEKRAKILNESKYEGNYIFAFDNIEDKSIIEDKLTIWQKYSKKSNPCAVLYCFCCFDKSKKYNLNFWIKDIIDLLERTKILMKYGARPYVMRFEKHKNSPFRKLYLLITQWCNSGDSFQKQSLRNYTETHSIGERKTLSDFENKYPEIASKYFDMKFNKDEPNPNSFEKTEERGQINLWT